MELVVSPDGDVRCIYGELIELDTIGEIQISRASHVEPDARGQWFVSLAIVDGPMLGPFDRRSQALTAELEWLRHHWLCPNGLVRRPQ